MEFPLPAVLTVDKGLNEPRYPSLPGIMKARRKEIKTVTAEHLGLAAADVGMAAARATLVRLSPPPARKAGRIVEGDAAQAVSAIISFLKDEAKVLS